MTRNEIIKALETLRPGSTFLAVNGYTSEGTAELANYSICFHFSYKAALESSILTLESLVPETDLDAQAKTELIASFQASLDKMATTPVAEIDDAYTRFPGVDGIKMHTETGTLHIFGLLNNKRTITPGTYKKVNSKPLTIAKDRLRKLCRVSKFRQFIIKPENVESIRVQGLELLPPG